MRCIRLLIILLVVVVLLGVLFIYSGIYNVSATRPDGPIAEWLFSTTMDHSVKRHAAGIKVPNLDDPATVRLGMAHYNRMCVGCHGAPGVEPRLNPKSLNPSPPPLTDVAKEFKPNELFWMVRNGIRMSAMPAFGVGNPDKELWAVTAFLRTLPNLKPADYKRMSSQAPKVMD